MDYEKKNAKQDLNIFMFTGNIGRVQELRYLPNGNAVLNFSVAIGDDYKTKEGEVVEKTVWIDLSVFGTRAEGLNKVIRKFKSVAGTGKLQPAHAWLKDGEALGSNKLLLDKLNVTVWKKDSDEVDPFDDNSAVQDDEPW